MTYRKLNQSGAVSMLSVMIFALIITVIASAYISSVISQQKNALSFDQSTRAYYAAESGVQDTIRSLRAHPERLDSDKEACKPWDDDPAAGTIGASADYKLSYTCQLVTPEPPKVSGTVEPSGAKNVTIRMQPTAPTPGPYNLVVRWSARTEAGETTYYPIGRTGSSQKLLGRYNEWNQSGVSGNPIHAMLRIGVIAHPNSGISRGSIDQQVLYLNPTTTPESTPRKLVYGSQVSPQQQDQLITNGECVASNATTESYACKAIIRLDPNYDLSSHTLYIRVGSVYRSTGFSLELTNALSVPQEISDTEAVIDITGKSGNETFKRIQQTVSIGGYAEDSIPDSALVAGQGICKLLSLGSTPVSYTNGCTNFYQ